jgi:pimeloyl-ACP methyl ester carboxylesterase
MFDKRGTGLSDRVSELPGSDERIGDLRAVTDAAGMEQAALLGISEGRALAALFAATYPARCRALVLSGGFARFTSWFPTEEAFQQFPGFIDQAWGSVASLPFIESSH